MIFSIFKNGELQSAQQTEMKSVRYTLHYTTLYTAQCRPDMYSDTGDVRSMRACVFYCLNAERRFRTGGELECGTPHLTYQQSGDGTMVAVLCFSATI